jgi:hypothetical protein
VMKLMPQVVELLGAAGLPLPGVASCDTIALPLAGRATLIGALKTRPNWYSVARKDIGKLARLVTERNWFARTVNGLKAGTYGLGFRFADPAAQEWADAGDYPFAQMQEDLILEWLVSDAVVAWWRKDAESGALPVVNVPNIEDVDYEIIGGVEQITVRLEQKRNLKPELEQKMGKRMWDAVRAGKLVITRDDKDFDFEVMKAGKSAAPFQPSPLVTIFDDLDFVEAIRIGDWNGAKARWEIIRHTKKGYGTPSGPQAGSTRGNAKTADLKAILKGMKEILGKTDIATNYDQEIDYLIFPKEHFHPELLAETKQRLLFWAGIFGVLLLKSDSQITGLSEFMMNLLRTEVLAFRAKLGKFLVRIYRKDSFRQGIPNMPELVPVWSVKPLYTNEGFIKHITALATFGIAAPQTLREMFDIDNEAECERMLEAHEEPKAYTPPFEPRQGIGAAFTIPQDEPEGGNQKQNALPGEPGRPET